MTATKMWLRTEDMFFWLIVGSVRIKSHLQKMFRARRLRKTRMPIMMTILKMLMMIMVMHVNVIMIWCNDILRQDNNVIPHDVM